MFSFNLTFSVMLGTALVIAPGCTSYVSSDSSPFASPTEASASMNAATGLEQWDVPTQVFSGFGASSIQLKADTLGPRLINFTFEGAGRHSADFGEAYIFFATKQRTASVFWTQVFGNTATVKVKTSGAWAITVRSLLDAPRWDSTKPLVIHQENAVFQVVMSEGANVGTSFIDWQATGCPVSSPDTQVWIGGGGGIKGSWYPKPGKLRAASIYLDSINESGRRGIGVSGGDLTSQSSTYSGQYFNLVIPLVIQTSTDCTSLTLRFRQ